MFIHIPQWQADLRHLDNIDGATKLFEIKWTTTEK